MHILESGTMGGGRRAGIAGSETRQQVLGPKPNIAYENNCPLKAGFLETRESYCSTLISMANSIFNFIFP
jgi:hypothetical protein